MVVVVEEVLEEYVANVVDERERDMGLVGEASEGHSCYEMRQILRAVVEIEVGVVDDMVAEAIQEYCCQQENGIVEAAMGMKVEMIVDIVAEAIQKHCRRDVQDIARTVLEMKHVGMYSMLKEWQ